jgi:hypothetical protein
VIIVASCVLMAEFASDPSSRLQPHLPPADSASPQRHAESTAGAHGREAKLQKRLRAARFSAGSEDLLVIRYIRV